MSDAEFYAKLNAMSRDELVSYKNAAVSSKKIIDVLGVSTLLLMLIFTNIFTILFGVVSVYKMGNMSVNINNTLNHIRAILSKIPDVDK